ncbi:MAG: hypothetical protein KGL66_02560 [Alphaproteobacteria bacterium]|nr:hypothetical protein [Alphaproteobacteria bacterium]MDE2350749.1 hypothetical protein [Alphaproteobacteria bacterium]
MDLSPSVVSDDPGERVLPVVTSAECARYMKDMLGTLARVAHRHEHLVLVHLLKIAAREAERLAQS